MAEKCKIMEHHQQNCILYTICFKGMDYCSMKNESIIRHATDWETLSIIPILQKQPVRTGMEIVKGGPKGFYVELIFNGR